MLALKLLVAHGALPHSPLPRAPEQNPTNPLFELWALLKDGMGARCSYYGVDYLPDFVNRLLSGRDLCPTLMSSYFNGRMALTFFIAGCAALWYVTLVAQVLRQPPADAVGGDAFKRYNPGWLSILVLLWVPGFIYLYSSRHLLYLPPEKPGILALGVCSGIVALLLIAWAKHKLRAYERALRSGRGEECLRYAHSADYTMAVGLMLLAQSVLYWALASWFFALSASVLLLFMALAVAATWERTASRWLRFVIRVAARKSKCAEKRSARS